MSPQSEHKCPLRFSDHPRPHAPALQVPRPVRELRGEDVLVGAARLPHARRLPEGQVRQRLRDGGGEAPRVTGLGGDSAGQVQLLQAPHRARPGLLRGLAELLRAQHGDRLLWDA